MDSPTFTTSLVRRQGNKTGKTGVGSALKKSDLRPQNTTTVTLKCLGDDVGPMKLETVALFVRQNDLNIYEGSSHINYRTRVSAADNYERAKNLYDR